MASPITDEIKTDLSQEALLFEVRKCLQMIASPGHLHDIDPHVTIRRKEDTARRALEILSVCGIHDTKAA